MVAPCKSVHYRANLPDGINGPAGCGVQHVLPQWPGHCQLCYQCGRGIHAGPARA
ncbi:unnamed protein product [Symbiodinium pilosum]|uniref:Uncharacterized protein n=1 Tax=Symbiodinium pilosum TaxID=2952 RepID=A0A812UYU1_SYMPI|nr:unnamed protein product [Symbiodinium pilosum]